MKPRFLILGIVLLVACSPTPTPTPTATATPLPPTEPPTPTATATLLPTTETPQPVQGPAFEPAGCFSADLRTSMSGGGYDLACGYLVVPEDRSQPEGRQVKLPVMVFHTQNPNPRPDPMIYLAGGGGFNMMPLGSYQDAVALAADLPPSIADHYLFNYSFWQSNLCAAWEIEPNDPAMREAVVSDVPALVFAGQFDPITPPEWGRLAAKTLSNSFFYELPNLGHGVMDSNQCALEIGLQFLDDPATEPDVSCIEDLPSPDFK